MGITCLFTVAFLLFLMPALSFALEQSALPNPSGGLGSERTAPSLVPKRSEGLENKANTPNQPSHYLGIDSQGGSVTITPR
jgi:hypothetical protein